MPELSTVAASLIEYGLLGVLLTMPLAVLLALGVRKRNRLTAAFGGVCFLSLAFVILGVTLSGLESGSGFAVSRATLMVERSENPAFFWVSTVVFAGVSVAMAVLAFYCFRRSIRVGPTDEPYNVTP